MPDPNTGKLKVCVITNTLTIGGAETQLLRLCQRVDPRRIALEVLYYGRDHGLLGEYRKTPARVTFIDKDGLGKPSFLLALAAHLRRGRYDVVHCWLGTANQYGLVAALLGGCRCILTGHRSLEVTPMRTRRWLDRTLARFTRGRVVNSFAIRSCHPQRSGGYPGEKILVLHNGIDPAEFDRRKPAAQVRRELALPAGEPMIVSVGRLYAFKGPGTFIGMALEITRRGTNAQFVLVGDGPDRPSLEEMVERLGLTERVHFLGSRRDVRDIIGAADVSVRPSPEEGFPNVVLESMMAGVPVITAANGGGPEVVGDGEQVVPVNDPRALADKVLLLLAEPAQARQWIERQRRRALMLFTIDIASRNYADLLEKTYNAWRLHTALPAGLAWTAQSDWAQAAPDVS